MALIKANLALAKALIDTPDRWFKGAYANEDQTCLCTVGAVTEAWPGGSFNLIEELTSFIPTAFVPAAGDEGLLRLAQYNDHPDTTHADIMALFDRAIAAQDGAA